MYQRSNGAHDPRVRPQLPPIPAAAPHSRGCPAPRLATRRGRCCYRDPLSGGRCTSSHLLQIDHLLPVAQGGGPEPSNLQLAWRSPPQNAPAATDRAAAGATDVAPPPHSCRAARLRWPTACRWPAGTHFAAPRAERCIFAAASSELGRSLSTRSCKALSRSHFNEFLPLPAFVPGPDRSLTAAPGRLQHGGNSARRGS